MGIWPICFYEISKEALSEGRRKLNPYSVNLKNYTSEVPASRSISRIEKMLVEIGAKNINKQYEDSTLRCITFLVDRRGNTYAFRLPAKVDVVERVLKTAIKRPRENTFARIAQQAERTAWKIVSDWVEVQVAMIQLEQTELEQVFLPYHYYPEDNSTLWDRVSSGDLKLLKAATND